MSSGSGEQGPPAAEPQVNVGVSSDPRPQRPLGRGPRPFGGLL